MSLDGLRAWIGEVERKLGARTRVFLVLLAIAIGASGAAIYLALDADDGGGSGSSGGASAEEVQQLREQVELEGGESPQISALEAQIVELRTEIEALDAKDEASGGQGAKDESGKNGIPETEAQAVPESEAKK
jgi:hypothetical protein